MKIIALASGGLDSTVLLAKLKSEGHEVRAFGIHYGQRHWRELDALHHVCGAMGGIPREVLYLEQSALFSKQHAMAERSVSAYGDKIPDGHYADASMKAIVVPNRNMALLALAGSLAIDMGCQAVAYAAHAGDHAIYPDCRPEFVEAMREALSHCSDPGLQLLAPFANKTKAEIVYLGHHLQPPAPMHLTWSCYRGGKLHCGRCGACTERWLAFQEAGIPDPTEYEA